MPLQLAPLLKVLTRLQSSFLYPLSSFLQATPSIVIHPRDVPLLADPSLTVEIQVKTFSCLCLTANYETTKQQKVAEATEKIEVAVPCKPTDCRPGGAAVIGKGGVVRWKEKLPVKCR